MVDRVHHAAIAVSDLTETVPFYEAVLGFEPLGPDDPDETIETADYYWMAVGDGQWVNLAERPEATPEPTGRTDDPHLGFAADEDETGDIAARLRERGIDVRETETGIYFRDRDDNYFEVTHWDGPDPDRWR